MTISRRNVLSLLPVGVVAGFSLPSAALAQASSSASPSEVKKLLQHFRKSPGIEADFVEEKHIALLAAPLKQEGTIYFLKTGSLARVVKKPRASHIVITGDRIIAKDANGRRSIDLSDKPTLRGLVGSLLHVLSGDEKKLEAFYEVRMTGTAQAIWSLRLKPKTKELSGMISSFSFEGKGLILKTLTVNEANGDKNTTRFKNVDTKRHFSAKEVKNLFEI